MSWTCGESETGGALGCRSFSNGTSNIASTLLSIGGEGGRASNSLGIGRGGGRVQWRPTGCTNNGSNLEGVTRGPYNELKMPMTKLSI